MTPQEIVRQKILLMDEELKFLRYFYHVAGDFMGPADCEIYSDIRKDWLTQHGSLPKAYEEE
jgi:hypothetical protein